MCQLSFDEESIYEISKLYLNKFCNVRSHGRTDKAKAICPFNFSEVGGIKMMSCSINNLWSKELILFALLHSEWPNPHVYLLLSPRYGVHCLVAVLNLACKYLSKFSFLTSFFGSLW